MTKSKTAEASERGAVLVHVALALLALIAFSTFVVDYGVLWTSRRQAQNAADAAAMSGAVSLAFDPSGAPFSTSGPAHQAAYQVVMSHGVWGQQPANDITFPTDCPTSGVQECVRVDVYRDAGHNNPLPMIFGQLVGMSTQGVRAMAIARAAAANAGDCVKPFGVPDFYAPDLASYSAPGYTLQSHLGQSILLKGGAGTQLGSGWFRLLDLDGSATGGTGGPSGTNGQILSCISNTIGVGEDLIDQNGNIGNNVSQMVNELYNLDPGASFDTATGRVINTCADNGTCMKFVYTGNGNQTSLVPDPTRSYSPRVLLIPVFDPALFFSTGAIHVVNILGFFIEAPMAGPPNFDLRGTLVNQPGVLKPGAGSVPNAAAFAKVIHLIK